MSKLAIPPATPAPIPKQNIFRRSNLWIGSIVLTLSLFSVPIAADQPDLSQERFESNFSQLKADMRQVRIDGERRRLAVLEEREAARDPYATDAAQLEA